VSTIRYSVVIPVFRGAGTLGELCDRLVATLSKLEGGFEIIFVDDGSRDESWQQIRRIAAREPRVLGLHLTRNFGQHNATLCGIRHARGELILTLDEDLQHPPEEIPKLIRQRAKSGSDVVYGIPEARRHSWWRRLGSRLVMLIPRLATGGRFDLSSFRIIRAPIAAEVAKSLRHDIVLDVYFSWISDRIESVRVEHHEAARGSSYSLFGLLRMLLSILYNYTVFPLRISSVLGGIISLVSLVLAAYYFIVKLVYGPSVEPGFSALIVSILFSTGVILLAIGMVSEYLARTFLHVIRKPQSVVRETTAEPQTMEPQDEER